MCVECQPNKDHKLLSQMEFDDSQQLNVRIVSTLSIGSFSATQVRMSRCCLPLCCEITAEAASVVILKKIANY